MALSTVNAVPHIALQPGVPGIFSLLSFRPETAGPLTDLVNVLLRGPNSLLPAERELIAAYVSSQNACVFCRDGHGAIAAAFCMYNRYVDGLAAWTPDDPDGYRQQAKMVAERGYGRPPSAAAPVDRG